MSGDIECVSGRLMVTSKGAVLRTTSEIFEIFDANILNALLRYVPASGGGEYLYDEDCILKVELKTSNGHRSINELIQISIFRGAINYKVYFRPVVHQTDAWNIDALVNRDSTFESGNTRVQGNLVGRDGTCYLCASNPMSFTKSDSIILIKENLFDWLRDTLPANDKYWPNFVYRAIVTGKFHIDKSTVFKGSISEIAEIVVLFPSIEILFKCHG